MEPVPPSIARDIASGAALARQAFAIGLKPDPAVSVAEWMEANLQLPTEVSPRPGPWNFDEAPYLREIADCLDPSHPCREAVFAKSAQTGGTMLGVGWIGAIADAAPAAMGVYLPTIDQAKAYNKLKLQPIIDATPAMRRKIYTQRSRDEMGSSTLFKRFTGGSCKITGTNASAGLQMASEKYQIKEEISEWLMEVEGRGDPDTQVDARRLAYLEEGAKVFTISTPGTKGSCRVTAKYEASDQRRYYVPCPDCGEKQVLKWERFKYEKAAPHKAEYICEHCGVLIAHHFKRWMIQNGEWRAENPGAGKPPGFHICRPTA